MRLSLFLVVVVVYGLSDMRAVMYVVSMLVLTRVAALSCACDGTAARICSRHCCIFEVVVGLLRVAARGGFQCRAHHGARDALAILVLALCHFFPYHLALCTSSSWSSCVVCSVAFVAFFAFVTFVVEVACRLRQFQKRKCYSEMQRMLCAIASAVVTASCWSSLS